MALKSVTFWRHHCHPTLPRRPSAQYVNASDSSRTSRAIGQRATTTSPVIWSHTIGWCAMSATCCLAEESNECLHAACSCYVELSDTSQCYVTFTRCLDFHKWVDVFTFNSTSPRNCMWYPPRASSFSLVRLLICIRKAKIEMTFRDKHSRSVKFIY